MDRRTSVLLLAALLVALPAALAQTTAPVLLERTDDGDLTADVGRSAVATFRLFNLNPTDDFYVSVATTSPAQWSVSVEPDGFFLQPRNATEIRISFEPEDAPRVSSATFEVTFSLVNGRTGEVTRLSETVDVSSGAAPRVLGIFPNPLPPPLDNAYGTFLLAMLFWTAIGVASVLVGNTVVRIITARASNATTREIIQKLQRPLFLFVLFLGLAASVAVLPRNPLVVFIERFLVAIAVIVYGLYVVYRLLDAALTYYQLELSKRTSTKVDDVVVPVLRKVGLVIVYVVGAILTLRGLGWDPTIVFAGAGIAGLVIAFAAQDTISNLFSGVFLMLDQPFREGDDIKLENGDLARVESIGLRTTRLYFGKHHELVVVPNNQLASKQVVNLAGPDLRYWIMIDVGVSYSSDPQHVKKVLLDTVLEDPRVMNEGDWTPLILFTGFGESSLNFIARFAIRDYRPRFVVASDLRFAIFKAFEREGIEIPFPQRTLHLGEETMESLRTVNQNR